MQTLIGAFLVIFGAAWVGFTAVRRLHFRTRTLSLLVAAIDFLHAEINYGLTPLTDIMKKMAVNYPELFFSQCSQRITQDNGFCVTWKAAIRELRVPLKNEEIDALDELGASLGRFDADNQSAAIKLARERLYAAYIVSRDEQSSKSRLFGFLGVAAGALVTILLI